MWRSVGTIKRKGMINMDWNEVAVCELSEQYEETGIEFVIEDGHITKPTKEK